MPTRLKRQIIIVLLIGLGLVALHSPGVAVADTRKALTLFHAGARRYLKQDIAARTIPADVWTTVIFGKTNFDLPDYRKGLYGAASIAGTGLYSTYQALGGEEPWLMEIKIKASCLRPERVFDGNFYVNRADPTSDQGSFGKWIRKHQSELAETAKTCLPSSTRGEPTLWKTGVYYDLAKASAAELEVTRICTPPIAAFFSEENLALIPDEMNESSWYIRDRDCIEDIRGTPDQLFHDLTRNLVGSSEDLLEVNLFGDLAAPGASSFGTILITMRVLAETTQLEERNLDQLTAAIGVLDESVTPTQMRETERSPSLDKNWNGGPFVKAAFLAARKAIQKKKVADFQAGLQRILDEMIAEHGRACKSEHGVDETHRNACSKAANVSGRKLLRFLQGSR